MAIELGVKPTGMVEIIAGSQRRRFSNLVLDDGWASLLSRMGSSDGDMVPRWLSLGTGESEPEQSQEGLEEREASTEREATGVEYGGFVSASSLTAYSEAMVRFEYEPGELTGEWTELGLSYGSGYAEPYNRALIRDENGVPTPLLVMSDEPVTAYIRLRLYMGGWGRSIDLGGRDNGAFQGHTGTIALEGGIADSENGIWLKGFPIYGAEMGGESSQLEGLDTDQLTAKHYIVFDPSVGAGYSQITFHAREESPMVRLNFSPSIQKPTGVSLHFRARISVIRE